MKHIEDNQEKRQAELEWIFNCNFTVELPEQERRRAIEEIMRYMTEQIDAAFESYQQDLLPWEDEENA